MLKSAPISEEFTRQALMLFSTSRIFDLADVAKPVARGLTVLRVSRRSLACAAEQGIDTATVARLRKLAVVLAQDGTLVTCTHIHGGKAKSYLRSDRRKFWRA
jgi:hypothetical protein